MKATDLYRYSTEGNPYVLFTRYFVTQRLQWFITKV